MTDMSNVTEHDLVIVGAGPAGLSSALYATRYGLDAITLERSAFGGQITTTSDVDNYPGLPGVGGAELGEAMRSHAESLGASFVQDEVTGLAVQDGRFVLSCYGATYSCRTLVYAAGAEPRRAGFVGEDTFRGRGVSYCATCDGMFYRNKRVIVIGGGNTACAEALFLSKLAAEVTMVVRKDHLRADESLKNAVSRNGKIKVRYLTKLASVEGAQFIESFAFEDVLTGETMREDVEPGSLGVFVAVGQKPSVDLVVPFVELANDGSILTDERMATKKPGLFCAGDVRSKPLRQVVTAVSDGAVAAHSAAAFLESF